MRGDRPPEGGETAFYAEFTPHARGSTASGWRGCVVRRVYPACAGIDLNLVGLFARSGCLPRMRGDRPIDTSNKYQQKGFTPHARGSTLNWLPERLDKAVYPACAGIDPSCLTPSERQTGLPRMRGDRPSSCLVVGRPVLFTPHARGSTSVATIVTHGSHVYPACAGIDLAQKTCTLV